jgi:hypothetical protein
MSSPWEDGEQAFSMSENGQAQRWVVPRLWEAAKGLPVHLVAIDTLPYLFDGDSWLRNWANPDDPQVQFEASRTAAADLAYPVILHPNGHLMDGYHRVCKALQLGFTHVQSVRFTEDSLPEPDETWGTKPQQGT